MAAVDRVMAERFGVGVLQLMELAGWVAASAARAMLPGGDPRGRRVLVLAGRGGNGGDGLVAGRLLHGWGAEVEARLSHPPERLNPAATRQLVALQALGVPVLPPGEPGSVAPRPRADEPPFDLVVDALLGFGLAGPPTGHVADLIRLANGLGAPVLAVDLPSGLDAATGRPFDPCVRADRTITLGLPKRGLLELPARPFVGSLAVADIGIPPVAYAAVGVEVGPLFALGSVVEVF
jgi:NAD(P)H-hydrate epimerase